MSLSERERIARIVDPGAWEDWDNLSADTSGTLGIDWQKFARNRVGPSLAKADAILARPEPSEAAACLSWALDLLDLYDAKMIRDGERESDVLSELHVEAKMRARRALEAITDTR